MAPCAAGKLEGRKAWMLKNLPSRFWISFYVLLKKIGMARGR
jgi:hypothetical protein